MVEQIQMITTSSFSLLALRRKLERGVFAVPQLQREFVWTKQKACQLLDSDYIVAILAVFYYHNELHPRWYLKELSRNRRVLRGALRSRLIPDGDGTGIWDRNLKRGFRRFVKDRGRLIAHTFEAAAGARLFSRE
jgi:hypothetical protein